MWIPPHSTPEVRSFHPGVLSSCMSLTIFGLLLFIRCVCHADACGGHRGTCVFPQGLSTVVLGKALSLKPTLTNLARLASFVNSADVPISAFSVLGLQMCAAVPGYVCVCVHMCRYMYLCPCTDVRGQCQIFCLLSLLLIPSRQSLSHWTQIEAGRQHLLGMMSLSQST